MTEHLQMSAFCVYLWILRSFWEYLFYRAPLWNCLFHLQIAEFQPVNTVKNSCAFQAFNTRTRSRHSKVLIYLKTLKTIKLYVKKLICNEIMKCQPASLWRKTLFTHPPSCILSSFSQNASRLLLPKRLWKCASAISFRKHKRKLVLLL